MTIMLMMAALGSQGAATQPRIEVAQANWAAFERIDSRLTVPTTRMIETVESVMRSGACNLPGQRLRRFNFNVSYAIRFDEAARVERVVVEDIGCRPIEEMVGGAVSDMLRHSMFVLPQQRASRWYGNRINFNLDG
jgi:hypothetical protein